MRFSGRREDSAIRHRIRRLSGLSSSSGATLLLDLSRVARAFRTLTQTSNGVRAAVHVPSTAMSSTDPRGVSDNGSKNRNIGQDQSEFAAAG